MTKYKFDEIAINSTQKKKPTEEDKVYYIGLEHIDPGCFDVVRWGSDVAPTGDKLLMQKGDVLFGKRRAYQRKVAIAPFDGIFSAHGMVLRPNLKVIDANYFPFFISSDKFMETAVRISVGGLSPTINWKDLARQEFELPSLDEQKVLADKLWAAYRLKEAYKKLLVATDEMVKSQFIEMFGDCKSQGTLSSLCATFIDGDWIESKDQSDNGIRLIQTGNVGFGFFKGREDKSRYITEETFKKLNCTEVVPGDILISRLPDPIGRACIVPEGIGKAITAVDCTIVRLNATLLPEFLISFSKTALYASQINKIKTGTTRLRVSRGNLGNVIIPIPPIESQHRFAAIVQQADKSKFGDFKSQFIEMFGSPFENNSEMVPLSSLCSINPSKPKGLDDFLSVSFIPMDRISEDGEYTEFETKPLKDVKKGFTFCAEDDVLFAKITPCMENGKGAILKGLSNGIGFGSTEFHVLRPIPGITNSEWLYFLTKLSGFRLDAAKNMTGTGGQKRVPSSYLLNFKVMRPQLVAQKEFAEIVRQADKSKSVIQKALVYLNDIQSVELGEIA